MRFPSTKEMFRCEEKLTLEPFFHAKVLSGELNPGIGGEELHAAGEVREAAVQVVEVEVAGLLQEEQT